ncbi:monovalent cation/H+ antiporter subunit D family protein [Candidatus Aminicenantes bacterium AC-334-K16]|jgi:multicomponent Na+:H+ antiporter subunit D|nr:monovalent cation/H+ antiporter subunit D family protein [Candidatus Aminicenantes bacterium AC-334-K16]
MMPSNTIPWPPLIYLFAGIFIPLAALKWRRLAGWLALVATAAAAFFSVVNLLRALDQGVISYRFGGWIPPIGIEYILDPLSGFVTTVINLIALGVLFHAHRSVEAEIRESRWPPYYALVMLFLTGANGIIMTGDFFNLYVFLEIGSLSLYGLIAVGEKKSPVAAFRYLVMGTVGGGFYLLGVGFLYLVTGSLNMGDVRNILFHLPVTPPLIVALTLMLIGLGIKMAVFPLHGWLPDAYTYAPSPTSAIMAPIGTKIGAYSIARIFFFIFGLKLITQVTPIAQVLAWLSAIGIIYGSILAMAQNEIKRMLAYSSVAQVGYIGLGLGLANSFGFIGALLHIMNHGLMKACLFLVAGNFRLRLGHSRIDRLDDSLRRSMPWSTAAFTLAALAMIGVPPTVGFFSKWYLALGAIEKKNWLFLMVILISSLLNAVYFFRVIERMYFRPVNSRQTSENLSETTSAEAREVGPWLLLPTLIFALALVVIGFLNVWIVKTILTKALPAVF